MKDASRGSEGTDKCIGTPKNKEEIGMPYKSQAQRRFFHSSGAKAAGISSATVKKYDSESKGKKLPEKVKGSPWPKMKDK